MRLNKKTIAAAVVVVLIFVAVYAYFTYQERYPSTDDAYVNANLISVAPKVSGYVNQVLVKNNQLVKKGEVLFRIETKDYAVQLNQQQQALNYAQEQAKAAQTQVNSAQANLTSAKSNYAFNQTQVERYTRLNKQQAAALEQLQSYQTKLEQAKAQLTQAENSLTQAKVQVEASNAQVAQANAGVQNALNHVAYTDVTSPVNGYVTNMYLTDGQFVAAGQILFGLVDNDNWWVDANYKETNLEHLKVGQKAKITLDMYKKAQYSGIVQSISNASGTTFSLIPAQNATGNWVKVTQRFTVRIKLKNNSRYPLRVGATATSTIDTTKN